MTQRLEPVEKACPRCGRDKCEIGCEKRLRFEDVPAKASRHEILRPKLACPGGPATTAIASLPPTPAHF